MSMASAKSGPDLSHYPGGEGLYRLRHSAAHILATAVTELFPDVKVAGGPPIDNGFYYDFARATPFTPEDLEKIEARMREIVAENQPFEYSESSREDALKRFEAAGEKYKVHFVGQIPAGDKVTLPAGTEMVMPGDNIKVDVVLVSPIACEAGLRFAIREGGKTVGAGVVTKILADAAPATKAAKPAAAPTK